METQNIIREITRRNWQTFKRDLLYAFYVHIFSNNLFDVIYYNIYIYDLSSGNMWGTCENGTEANGCGRPETFRNCADVSIITSTAGVPPLFVQQDNPFLLYYKDYRSPNNIFPLVVR